MANPRALPGLLLLLVAYIELCQGLPLCCSGTASNCSHWTCGSTTLTASNTGQNFLQSDTFSAKWPATTFVNMADPAIQTIDPGTFSAAFLPNLQFLTISSGYSTYSSSLLAGVSNQLILLNILGRSTLQISGDFLGSALSLQSVSISLDPAGTTCVIDGTLFPPGNSITTMFIDSRCIITDPNFFQFATQLTNLDWEFTAPPLKGVLEDIPSTIPNLALGPTCSDLGTNCTGATCFNFPNAGQNLCYVETTTTSITGASPVVPVPSFITGKTDSVTTTCQKTTALLLSNYLGRTQEVLACLQDNFADTPLLSRALNGGYSVTMNTTLAKALRDAYTACIRSFEQIRYMLAYAGSSNGVLIGAGNTVGTSYVLAGPSTGNTLQFYTPNMKLSTLTTIPNFNPVERPWFRSATTRCPGDLLCSAFDVYPCVEAAITGNCTTISGAWFTDDGGDAIVVAMDLSFPSLSNCGGQNPLIAVDIHDTSLLQTLEITPITSSSVNVKNAIISALTNSGGTAVAPVGLDHFTVPTTLNGKKANLAIFSAGTFFGRGWYLGYVR